MNIPVYVSASHILQYPFITKIEYELKLSILHRFVPGLQLAVINNYLKSNVEIISDDYETHNGILRTNSLEIKALCRQNRNALIVFEYLHYVL